jgi:hypothetical protein
MQKDWPRNLAWDQTMTIKQGNSEIAKRMYASHVTHQEAKEMGIEAMLARRKPPQGSNLIPDHRRGSCSPLGGQAKRSEVK